MIELYVTIGVAFSIIGFFTTMVLAIIGYAGDEYEFTDTGVVIGAGMIAIAWLWPIVFPVATVWLLVKELPASVKRIYNSHKERA